MKTIKKTTLIAAVTAMAAFAVPAMASATVWGPLNTNQSLDATSPMYYHAAMPDNTKWLCTGHHLGVHVRTPASSIIDITSASWTGCQGDGASAACGIMVMTPTGLPWTATAVGSSVILTMHVQRHWASHSCDYPAVFNVDGTVQGTWNASTHTLAIDSVSGLTESYMGMFVANVTAYGSLRNQTQTLTLT